MDSPVSGAPDDEVVRTSTGEPAFVITRTSRGWTVLTPDGTAQAADLVEAMSLADVVAEDLGRAPEPGRDARRAARGGVADEPDADPRDQQIAALQRTVGQLEHALATRVATERAIGVLAARRDTSPREAFEQLRREARSAGRPVHDLAREVLDSLGRPPGAGAHEVDAAAPVPELPAPAPAPLVESVPAERPARRRVERGRRQPMLVEGDR